jgi:hypothetical protein
VEEGITGRSRTTSRRGGGTALAAGTVVSLQRINSKRAKGSGSKLVRNERELFSIGGGGLTTLKGGRVLRKLGVRALVELYYNII